MTKEVSKPKVATAVRSYQNFINGQYCTDFRRNLRTQKPSDRKDYCPNSLSNQEDADAAIQAARRTFDQGHWSKSHARTRHDILRKTAEAREKASELAQTL